ncbi:hypothetical protein GC170_15070 [bacterium]|nr:hypothetical protein [bacterium]
MTPDPDPSSRVVAGVPETYELAEPNLARPPSRTPVVRESMAGRILTASAYFAALAFHVMTILGSLGGWQGLNSNAPILKDDHPLYLHSAVVTRSFLAQSGTTAGYDPTFMAGYPKSAVFPASSTLPEMVMAAFGGWVAPAVVYKWYVFLAATFAPVLILWAASGLARSRIAGALAAVVWMLYIWSDFPIQYVGFGMVPYFLAIPLALATLRVCVAWLENGGTARWLGMTFLLAATTLTHFTALMVLVPAAVGAWLFAPRKFRNALSGLVSGAAAAGVNAFWWWPGVVLAGTKGESGFAFSHPEGVIKRLGQIFWTEAPAEALLILGFCAGLPLMHKQARVAAAGLTGFAAAGFFWGYGAGAFRSLDFLQPGRHTYAAYSACAVISAYAIVAVVSMLRRKSLSAAIGACAGLLGLAVRLFGPGLVAVYSMWTTPGTAPLDSKPPAAYELIRNTLKGRVGPADRILYEEGGFGPDFFRGGRYSGVLARDLGVEFLGGPYLHAALTTNVAQFGEGKLAGRENWDATWLETVRKRYGLTWIVCWSDKARAVLDTDPDRYETILRDGPLRIARLKGANAQESPVSPTLPLAGGDFVEGPVVAKPGQIVIPVRPSSGTAVDREVILRYHWAPNLKISSPEGIEVLQENGQSLPDTAFPPLIRLRLKPSVQGPVELRIGFGA